MGPNEGLELVAQKKAEFLTLSKESPLGQTFVAGPKAVRLSRISTGLCFWPDSWQTGEDVTFSVYDSPAKNKKLFSRTLTFEHRWHKWDVPFDIDIKVNPGSTYYWEVTHNGGGDNNIRVVYLNSDVYPAGQAYVCGKPQAFDLYFQSIVKNKADKAANTKRMLDMFDYTRPELAAAKLAYDKGQTAKAAKLVLDANRELLRRADWLGRVKFGDKTDTARMDKLVSENRLYNWDKPDEWIMMDDTATWREVWTGTSEYVRANDVVNELGTAYAATHNEKYAKKMASLMIDYMNDYPSPFDGGMGGGHWVAMGIAWRLGDAWDGFARTLESKSVPDDVKLGWIYYFGRMAEFAMREHSGGNHANAVGEALMTFGHRFPLYKDSKTWQDFGFQKLTSNSLDLFLSDGACREPAMNYHGFSLSNLLSGLEQAKKYGYDIPKDVTTTTEKAVAYTSYMLMPNGGLPTNGDTDTAEFLPNKPVWQGWREGEAQTGWKMFGREDLRYISTAGKEGKRPATNSTIFPAMGHYILRSDWGGDAGKDIDQARWLLLQGHNFGSHGHWDMNQVTLYAYGRLLIFDPARTTYGTPMMYELTANRSHNVLLVDDLNMNRRAPKLNTFRETAAVDVADNTYADLYPGVDHRRAVVFVRPNYYVLFDTITGTAPHNYGLNFWLTSPGYVNVDNARSRVSTSLPDGANVVIMSGNKDISIAQRNGTIDVGDHNRSDIPVVTFWQKGQASTRLATLVYPVPAGANAPDVVSIESTPDGCIVTTGDGRDVISYLADGTVKVSRTDKSGKSSAYTVEPGK